MHDAGWLPRMRPVMETIKTARALRSYDSIEIPKIMRDCIMGVAKQRAHVYTSAP
jgi:hypothetical protein